MHYALCVEFYISYSDFKPTTKGTCFVDSPCPLSGLHRLIGLYIARSTWLNNTNFTTHSKNLPVFVKIVIPPYIVVFRPEQEMLVYIIIKQFCCKSLVIWLIRYIWNWTWTIEPWLEVYFLFQFVSIILLIRPSSFTRWNVKIKYSASYLSIEMRIVYIHEHPPSFFFKVTYSESKQNKLYWREGLLYDNRADMITNKLMQQSYILYLKAFMIMWLWRIPRPA